MKKYNANYTGTVISEWDYKGKHYEARAYEDCFNYICQYEDGGYLYPVGHGGYDYFHGDNWLPLAQKLGVHE